MNKTAVVLFNLGGPLSLTDIEPFLYSIFTDPEILRIPSPWRQLLAYIIVKFRKNKVRDMYIQLGGKSPLYENTLRQAKALEAILGHNYRVFIAMSHAYPATSQALSEIKAFQPNQIILLPLYPQYSKTTTGSSIEKWKNEYHLSKLAYPVRTICCYPTHPKFIQCMVDLIKPYLSEALKYGKPKLLFVAHGLPYRFIEEGDPYQMQVEQTYAALFKKIPIDKSDTILCYQSRVGPFKWLQPYIEDEIKKCAIEKRPIIVIPLSFVSEHLETLIELDNVYNKLALNLGVPYYGRVPTVGDSSLFIKALADLVMQPEIQPCTTECLRRME